MRELGASDCKLHLHAAEPLCHTYVRTQSRAHTCTHTRTRSRTQNPAVSSELLDIITSEFVEEGSLDRAIQLVVQGGGIEAAQQLARREADAALACLEGLADSPAKRSLAHMVDYVLERIH